MLLAGSFSYPPNADAAHYFVSNILPLIRRNRPDVTLRLVGEPTASVTALAGDPAVTVVGWVPDIEVELARADVAVVPLRYGSGTRVKILEAAAHRIPVVSTTIGAEGLGFEDGRHLCWPIHPTPSPRPASASWRSRGCDDTWWTKPRRPFWTGSSGRGRGNGSENFAADRRSPVGRVLVAEPHHQVTGEGLETLDVVGRERPAPLPRFPRSDMGTFASAPGPCWRLNCSTTARPRSTAPSLKP